ncbi:hypothetical protein ACIQM0_30465 [Streptomyces sp. NPDC091387]|uniref:hypothetical protein n=1 Tax=Streptomyces sp. NPDC091387 TaxID=3365998 RepID=UPI00382E0142
MEFAICLMNAIGILVTVSPHLELANCFIEFLTQLDAFSNTASGFVRNSAASTTPFLILLPVFLMPFHRLPTTPPLANAGVPLAIAA